MACTCANQNADSSAAQPSQADSSEVFGNGTVLDSYIATRGVVNSVTDDKLVLIADDPNYPGVRIEFEPGIHGLFSGLRQNQVVFVSFSVTQLLESTGERPTRIAATAFAVYVLFSPANSGVSRPSELYQDVLDKYAPAARDTTPQITLGVTVAQALANAMRFLTEDASLLTSPVCFYAILKAASEGTVVDKLHELERRYYLPYESDCFPASGPGNRGVVNVVYRLRSLIDQSETAILFPVRLRTFSAIANATITSRSDGFSASAVEVSAKSVCSFSCRKCRYAVEAARAVCVSACSGATGGVGLAACILACNIAADERKANC